MAVTDADCFSLNNGQHLCILENGAVLLEKNASPVLYICVLKTLISVFFFLSVLQHHYLWYWGQVAVCSTGEEPETL